MPDALRSCAVVNTDDIAETSSLTEPFLPLLPEDKAYGCLSDALPIQQPSRHAMRCVKACQPRPVTQGTFVTSMPADQPKLLNKVARRWPCDFSHRTNIKAQTLAALSQRKRCRHFDCKARPAAAGARAIDRAVAKPRQLQISLIKHLTYHTFRNSLSCCCTLNYSLKTVPRLQACREALF